MLLMTVGWLSWKIVRHRIDIVHANNDVTSSAAAILAALMTGRPCVCHLRGMELPWAETRWLFRHVNYFIAISDCVRAFYASRRLLNGKQVAVIYNGLNREVIQPAKAVGTVSGRGKFRVALAGRMIEYKGHSYFIKVADHFRSKAMEYEFFVYGDIPQAGDLAFPYFQQIRDDVRRHGLEELVRFAGQYTDLNAAMKEVDVLACCSPINNFERVLFEAMACSVPTVAFDSGGIREVGVDGVNCLLVPNRDVNEMAKAIARLASDEGLLRRIARGGVETAAEQFDYVRNARKVLRIYEGLCGRGEDRE